METKDDIHNAPAMRSLANGRHCGEGVFPVGTQQRQTGKDYEMLLVMPKAQ